MQSASVDDLACNCNVRSDIAAAVSIFVTYLGQALSAIILTGSLARGCFRQHTSDVDLLVVLGSNTTMSRTMSSVAQGLSGLSTPFDVTVMTSDQLATDEWPTPICWMIKPPGRIVTKPEGSKDALLHRHDASEAGIVIWRNRPVEVAAVPSRLVTRCVKYVFPFIKSRFKNPALMFSRVLYWFEYGSLCAKPEAASAVVTMLPARFQPLVGSDLASYNGEHSEPLDAILLAELERYIEKVIRTANPDRG